MLSPTEATARNRKVAMLQDEKLITTLETVQDPIAIRKPATRSALPMCNPKDRVFKKRQRFAKARITNKVALPISTPKPVVRDTQVNGITSFHQTKRVPQYAIDAVKVIRYLAK